MSRTREKFATQVNSDLLSAVRALAHKRAGSFRRWLKRLLPTCLRSASTPNRVRV
jgi:hypothetical protein